MSIETYITLGLVLSGGVILLFAILGTGKIFRMVTNVKYRKNWRLLLFMMLFFFLGYLFTAYIVWQGFENILSLLTGVVFFFGATFVFIVVQSGLYTITDLKEKSIEAIEKAKALKVAQEKLYHSNLELSDQNKQLEQFNYIASHDLQEPLRTITSVVSLLKLEFGPKLGSSGDQYLSFITQALTRMQNLIKSLLDYSRLGKVNSLPEDLDINLILKEVLDNMRLTLEETNAIVDIGTMPNVMGHRVEVTQLFQNIISNAIKFRKEDEHPKISLSAEKIDLGWQFAIKDEGIGIPDEHLQKIFVIFHRLHSKGEYEGSGIGLAYCKKIVDQHNGKIWVTSTLGEGSIFNFILPANKEVFEHESDD